MNSGKKLTGGKKAPMPVIEPLRVAKRHMVSKLTNDIVLLFD